jgi:hypothetical protein
MESFDLKRALMGTFFFFAGYKENFTRTQSAPASIPATYDVKQCGRKGGPKPLSHLERELKEEIPGFVEPPFFFPRTQSAPASTPAADNVKRGGRTGAGANLANTKRAGSPCMLPPTLPSSPSVPLSWDGTVVPCYYDPFDNSFPERTQSAPAKLLSDKGYNAFIIAPRSPDDFFDPGHEMDFECAPEY